MPANRLVASSSVKARSSARTSVRSARARSRCSGSTGSARPSRTSRSGDGGSAVINRPNRSSTSPSVITWKSSMIRTTGPAGRPAASRVPRCPRPGTDPGSPDRAAVFGPEARRCRSPRTPGRPEGLRVVVGIVQAQPGHRFPGRPRRRPGRGGHGLAPPGAGADQGDRMSGPGCQPRRESVADQHTRRQHRWSGLAYPPGRRIDRRFGGPGGACRFRASHGAPGNRGRPGTASGVKVRVSWLTLVALPGAIRGR